MFFYYIKLIQFSEADQFNQIEEILNGFSTQNVASLTTHVMSEVNQVCGDYLEKELKLYMGEEKYTEIADGPTVSVDDLRNNQIVEAGKFCTN